MKHDIERNTHPQPEVAPISDAPAYTSNNLIAQRRRDGIPACGSTPARRILTPVQAAELLGCDDKTITRWARQGYVPAHAIGMGKKKYWRFFEDELIAWLSSSTNGYHAA